MIGEMLWLRAKQIYRALASIGWLSLFVLPFLVLVLFGLFESAAKGSFTLALMMGVVLVSIHFFRGDQKFLSEISKQPGWIRIAEYFSLASIVALLQFVITGEYQNALWFIPFGLVLAWLPIPEFSNQRQWWLFPVDWIPSFAFEWRTGMRTAGGFWLLFLAVIIFTTQISPAIPLLYIILFGFSTSSWYDFLEPKEILDVQVERTNFLSNKIMRHLALLLFAQLIPIAIGIFYWPHLWYLFFIALAMTLLMLTFAILYKYANYQDERVRIFNQLPTGIFNGSILIPLLFIISLVYLIIYWKKAVINLKNRYA